MNAPAATPARTVVLLNDAAFSRGGGDRTALDSAIALGAAGNRVIVFAAMGPPAEELRSAPNVEVACLGQPAFRDDRSLGRGALRGLCNRPAAAALRRILAECDPATTIVHTHLYSSALSPAVPLAALRAGFRTVLTLHDYFITCPNGAYFLFPRATVCPHRPLGLGCLTCDCDSRSRLHKPWRLLRLFGQNVLGGLPRRLSAFVAVSETCRRTVRRHLPPGARLELIHNPVGLPQRPPVDVAAHRGFVFAGRLEAYKGPQLLAEAGRQTGLPVTFCGRGPLEADLRALNPAARVLGWLDRDALLAELRAARAFVFPSLVPETFGLAAVEALALGLPVIAARGTAAAEFVRDGENGLLFDDGSAADLGRALRRLDDPGLAVRLGREAHEHYWGTPFTMEGHVAALQSLYASVLADSRRAE